MAVRLTIRFFGRRKFRQAMDRNAKRVEPEMARNLRRAGEVIIGEAKKQFVGSRTRALYEIRGGRRRRRKFPRPVTSPPNKLGVFEGQYRKSITQDVKRTRRGRWQSEIGPEGIVYARVHELGIGRMPKRPVLEPAVRNSEAKVFRIIGTTFRVVT